MGRAWLDFYSFDHLIMGMLAFFISYVVIMMCGFQIEYALSYGVVCCLFTGIIFEMFENTLFKQIKFEKRKDSVENSLSDIILVGIGGISESIIFLFPFFVLLTINTILVSLLYGLHFIFKRKTLK